MDKWEFDKSVTDKFDDMLKRSIPQYEVMRDAVFSLGQSYRKVGTDIVDLGSSRGGAVNPFIKKYGAQNSYVLIEKSRPMFDVLKTRFGHLEDVNIVRILPNDIALDFPDLRASIILSILTIQFTPIEYRQHIIQNIYDSMVTGGAFIFVEKVLGSTAMIDDSMIAWYYYLKRANGYTKDEISKKKEQLSGVLVPVTAKWNEELLHMAGFKQVDCFWRWMNFAGWIAIK